MKGLTLCGDYFNEFGLPLIKNKFQSYGGRIASGLVGDGSDCFGFDDEISRDHDWGPGFCLWLTKEDYDAIGQSLHNEFQKLPKNFRGFTRTESEWGRGRTGVFEITGFYMKFIGLNHLPEKLQEWIAIPEHFLAEATNGRVFYDPLGEFTRWRERLLRFYPEDVRLKKIAARCMGVAQSGQYNFPRSFMRKEFLAARYAEMKFCADVISLVFLLNRRYAPFYKWMHRALRSLPVLGETFFSLFNDLIASTDYAEKMHCIDTICAGIIEELRTAGLSEASGECLLDHGPAVQARIKDPRLRAIDVWAG